MLEAKNLIKIYKPKRGPAVKALDNVSVKFPSKGMVFILGKSGSGKSTLLNVLGGLDSIDDGEIIIKGKSCQSFKQSDFDSYRNTFVGFIFQEYNLLEDFTVGANVALAISLQGRKPTDEEINKILREVDLDGMGNRKPNELSGGQKQRVAIARALVKNPEIIMADEPTGALDSNTGKQVFETLQHLAEDKLVLIVSHDREFAERYGDRVIELKDGRIIGDDSKTSERIEHQEEENDLTFSNSEIHVKKGYHLTESDLELINGYLERLNQNAIITNSDSFLKENRQLSSSLFKPTDVDSIEMSKEDYSLIKSKLPLKASFKIGASGLKNKKVRLVFTIILSSIAFTLFGLADTVGSYDYVTTAQKSLKDSNIDYASFVKYTKFCYSDDEDDFYWNESSTINDDDIKKVSDNTSINVNGVFNGGFDYSISNNIASSEDDEINNYVQTIFPRSFSGMTSITNDELVKDYSYSLDGSLPTSDNEIAISKFVASAFVKAGYVSVDDNGEASKTVIKINNESEMIGKKLFIDSQNYIIKGIVDTKFDYHRYDSLNDKMSDDDISGLILRYALLQELEYAKQYSLNSTLFVNDGYIEKMAQESDYYYLSAWNFSNVSLYSLTYDYGYGDSGTYDITSRYICNGDLINSPTCYFTSKHKLEDNEVLVSYYYLKSYIEYVCENTSTTYSIKKSFFDDYNYLSTIDEQEIKTRTINECDTTINLYSAICNVFDIVYESEAYNYFVNNKDDIIALFNETGETYSYQDMIDVINESYSYGAYNFGMTKNSYKEMNNEALSLISKMLKDKDFVNNLTMKMTKDYSNYDTTTVNIAGVFISNNERLIDAIGLSENAINKATDNYNVGYYSYCVGPMPTDSNAIKDIIEYSIDESNDVRYSLTNAVTFELQLIDEILKALKQIFLVVGIFFAVFASLMLTNFISTSVNYKKQDIGILRAIGSRSWDVFQIFFSEAFIIAMINFVLATVSTGIITGIINIALRNEAGILVSVLTFSIRQVGLILLLSIFVAFIATILPVYIHAKKKPIDAIRNR